MFRKITSLLVVVSLVLTAAPVPLAAQNWGGGVAEISQDPGDFLPILSATTYVPPTPGTDELAYFAATDLAGRLWSVDVNLSKSIATYTADDGRHRVDQLNSAQVSAFRSASALASAPDRRIQCLAHPVCAGIVGTVIGIGISALYFDAACRFTASAQSGQAADNLSLCQAQMLNGIARGKECTMIYVRREANLDECFGGSVTCSVHCN